MITGIIAKAGRNYYSNIIMGNKDEKNYFDWQILITKEFVLISTNITSVEKIILPSDSEILKVMEQYSYKISADINTYPLEYRLLGRAKLIDLLKTINDYIDNYEFDKLVSEDTILFSFNPFSDYSPDGTLLPQIEFTVNGDKLINYRLYRFGELDKLLVEVDIFYQQEYPNSVSFTSYENDLPMTTRILHKYDNSDIVGNEYFTEEYFFENIEKNDVQIVEKLHNT
ncbi:MAG: hypothetical protein ACFCU1_03570 [Sumerlaeia bacterium]